MQGEGSVIPAESFCRGCVVCDRHQALPILMKCRRASGRTGELYAYMRMALRRYLMTTAKALGEGLWKIGAFDHADYASVAMTPGTHGATTAAVIRWRRRVRKSTGYHRTPECKTASNSATMRLLSAYKYLNVRFGMFSEIRGLGLLAAVYCYRRVARKAKLIAEGSGKSRRDGAPLPVATWCVLRQR
ncbi:aminotransferase class III-fold pyridoxal phosphate-dependent enzyme [Salmonella enterica subsp. enterica]|nr:aminotransferase class III-fold pyridoxal phosphate-dependent enzyme [Salmonella enterica subsp. enterica]